MKLQRDHQARLLLMKSGRGILGLATAMLLLLGLGRSEAKTVGFSFSGTLNFAYYIHTGEALPGVTNGDGGGQNYSGIFTFDDQAPPVSNNGYAWTVGTLAVTIGNYTYSYLRFNNTSQDGEIDLAPSDNVFNVSAQSAKPESATYSELNLSISGPPFLSSDILSGISIEPITSPSLGSFSLDENYYPPDNPNLTYNINGFITQIAPLQAVPIPLNIRLINNNVILTWNDPLSVFVLQSAPTPTGVYTNVPGATSPYTNTITGAQQFFQLVAPAD